ncbi:MAG: preprotein translocase subunit YajC [Phycisphaerales bacterium]
MDIPLVLALTPTSPSATPVTTGSVTAAPAAKQVEIPGMPTQATGTTTVPAAPVGGVPAGKAAGGAPDLTFLFIISGLFIFLILTSVLGGRKEKKKRAELLNALARNDRVQTIGGVIGTVVEMRDDEVVLRVDENTNTRITFSKGSVQQILRKANGSANTPSATSQAEAKPNGNKIAV